MRDAYRKRFSKAQSVDRRTGQIDIAMQVKRSGMGRFLRMLRSSFNHPLDD